MTTLAPKRILAAVTSERPAEALLRAWTVQGQARLVQPRFLLSNLINLMGRKDWYVLLTPTEEMHFRSLSSCAALAGHCDCSF